MLIKSDIVSEYEIQFMKRLKKNNSQYWVFPIDNDIQKMKVASILEIRPQIDLDMSMSTSRLVVMTLHNHDIIVNMSRKM